MLMNYILIDIPFIFSIKRFSQLEDREDGKQKVSSKAFKREESMPSVDSVQPKTSTLAPRGIPLLTDSFFPNSFRDTLL